MNLKGAPFYLNTGDIQWVEDTLSHMTLEEKIGQLFCPIGYSTDRDYLKYELLGRHIGGLFFRDGLSREMRDTFQYVQENSRIPLLIPSNLEAGGDGAAIDGTAYGRQMQVAAAGDPKYAYRLGRIACSEGAALGINWAFAPVVDIDLNFRNPITNVRTYGSRPEQVIENSLAYMKAADECALAVSVKHFPGDGVDERDQHLLTSVNSMTMEEWDETYGRVYRAMIGAGAKTVMAGHIAMPAYQEFFAPETRGRILPASLSRELLLKLLREKLGFEGLIITDATPMVGFTSAMERELAVPLSIENGCDMFLFNKDLEEDYHFMLEGYQKGILSKERLLDANRRILALKASLKLHIRQKEGTLIPPERAMDILRCPQHMAWAEELADQSITLVKDIGNQLPVNAEGSRRVLLEVLGPFPSNERVMGTVKEALQKKGFAVTEYEKEDFSKGIDNVRQFKEKYDLVLYIANIENASNRTTNRLEWYTFWGQGNNVPWFVYEVPCIFASVGNPYHLLDVPMMKTYINCYSNNDSVLNMLVEKITGAGPFKGVSPVDPFCGRKELAY